MKLLTAVVGVGVSSMVLAGPLTPPAGAPSPTAKPLSEVEPRIAVNAENTPGDANSVFRIAQSGSYYLTGDVVGQVGKHGIEIVASRVTLDLNGFVLQGVPGSLTGVAGTGSQTRVTNGVVSGWGINGVALTGVRGHRVDGVDASSNTGDGIRVNVGAIVDGCVTHGNTGSGIYVGAGSIVLSSTAMENGVGVTTVGCCVTMSNLHVYRNTGNGIAATSSAAIYDSVITENGGSGVTNLNNGVLIGCAITFNFSGGVQAGSRNILVGNQFSANNGDGLSVSGFDNRIEGNNFSTHMTGLRVSGAGNFVARNTASGNTINWNIVAGNAVAPIVAATTNGAAINGATYAGSLGTTDPNANFSY